MAKQSKKAITVEVLKAEKKNLKLDVKRLKAELRDERVRYTTMSDAKDAEIEALQTESAAKGDQITSLEHDVSRFQAMGKENAHLNRQISKGRAQVEDLELQIERLQGQIQHFKNLEARVEEWEAAKKAKREMHSQATRENVFLRRDLSKCRLKIAEIVEGVKELGDAGKPLQKLLGVGENGGKQ